MTPRPLDSISCKCQDIGVAADGCEVRCEARNRDLVIFFGSSVLPVQLKVSDGDRIAVLYAGFAQGIFDAQRLHDLLEAAD